MTSAATDVEAAGLLPCKLPERGMMDAEEVIARAVSPISWSVSGTEHDGLTYARGRAGSLAEARKIILALKKAGLIIRSPIRRTRARNPKS